MVLSSVNLEDLYDEQEKDLMKIAYESVKISASHRIDEFISFAKKANYHKIGIAHCIRMQKYADKFARILKRHGFDVYYADCKKDRINNCEFPSEESRIKNTPLYQAKYLEEKNTDINVNIGLCLGHELMFIKKSHAPVTTILVRDFATKHRIVKSLE
jgi:uncharacterized metal-binding protein